MTVFPSAEWCRVTPSDADFDSEKLAKAVAWLDGESGEGGYRLAIVKGGRLVLESRRGFAATEALPIASAAKSFYSNVLGIAVQEDLIPDEFRAASQGTFGYLRLLLPNPCVPS